VRLLTTIPDSTSLKFLVVGTLARKDAENGRHVVIHIDFASLNMRKCSESDGDFEKWYARKIGGQPDCLMGHKVRGWLSRP
jgi:Sortilin, neurotensin receptor 3, C-terminal